MRLAALFFLCAAICSAQTCSTHSRRWKNPRTWMKSNMCQEDYVEWVVPRLHDHWYTSKSFYGGVGIIGGVILFDALSTSTHYPYIETNKFLGPHPSDRKFAAVAGIEFGALTSLHAAAWHFSHQDPSKVWRTIGTVAIPFEAAAAHVPAGFSNLQLPKYQCPKTLVCR